MPGLVATRRATDNDVAFMTDVFLRAMQIHITAARGYWDEAREQAQFHEQLQLPQTRIVEHEGLRVGFFMTIERGQDIELHTLCVAPEHQRQGFGTVLTRQLVEEAFARKCGVVLSVLRVNAAARRFYDRLGFVLIEESAHHYHMRLAP